jgi:hypothetical protein
MSLDFSPSYQEKTTANYAMPHLSQRCPGCFTLCVSGRVKSVQFEVVGDSLKPNKGNLKNTVS